MLEIPNIKGLDRDQVLTLVNCRSYPQFLSMIGDYEAADKCPFCNPLDAKNVVLQEAGRVRWRIWKNPFPLKHTQLHLVMAPVDHTVAAQLNYEHYTSMMELFAWAFKEFNIPGGALAMRFGSPEFNAGSVLHHHANIIVPDGTGEVRVTLAKKPDEVATGIARMKVFEKIRMGADLTDLSVEETALIEGRMGE